MKAELVYITPDAAAKIEQIASVCYDSEPTGDFRILKGCMQSGHLSVAEHSDVTFKITCSRACSHQLVRHRTAKPTQRSQRYCNEDNFAYHTPSTIANNELALDTYKEIMSYINDGYKHLVELGVPAEDARYVLPNACETVLYMTFDFRNLFHFLNERLCRRAQEEIRHIAQQMAAQVVAQCPVFAPYCVPKCERFEIAFCPEAKSCGRHKKLKEMLK